VAAWRVIIPGFEFRPWSSEFEVKNECITIVGCMVHSVSFSMAIRSVNMNIGLSRDTEYPRA
jgi:hypothetical protein